MVLLLPVCLAVEFSAVKTNGLAGVLTVEQEDEVSADENKGWEKE